MLNLPIPSCHYVLVPPGLILDGTYRMPHWNCFLQEGSAMHWARSNFVPSLVLASLVLSLQSHSLWPHEQMVPERYCLLRVHFTVVLPFYLSHCLSAQNGTWGGTGRALGLLAVRSGFHTNPLWTCKTWSWHCFPCGSVQCARNECALGRLARLTFSAPPYELLPDAVLVMVWLVRSTLFQHCLLELLLCSWSCKTD